MVIEYVKVLLSTDECKYKIEECDIGIVTPYRMQANKILYHCENNQIKTDELTLGTAAILQGQEKPIIIISTVSIGCISNLKPVNISKNGSKT